jgi:membrane-associated phospholipid phosphatase
VNLFDRILEIFITVTLIVGGYQPYFWAQRQTFYPARYLTTRFDALIGFDPRWVWVYSGLYYPMILMVAMAQPDWRSYAVTVGGFLLLLACQMYFFIRHPVAIPDTWRHDARNSLNAWRYTRSMRFMETVWGFDKLRNSLPSMHVSVATMVDLTISHSWPWFAWVGWLFPVLIGASALKTKQHYVVDVLPGAAIGAAVYFGWRWFVS